LMRKRSPVFPRAPLPACGVPPRAHRQQHIRVLGVDQEHGVMEYASSVKRGQEGVLPVNLIGVPGWSVR